MDCVCSGVAQENCHDDDDKSGCDARQADENWDEQDEQKWQSQRGGMSDRPHDRAPATASKNMKHDQRQRTQRNSKNDQPSVKISAQRMFGIGETENQNNQNSDSANERGEHPNRRKSLNISGISQWRPPCFEN